MKKAFLAIVGMVLISTATVYAKGDKKKSADCCKPNATCCHKGTPCCDK